MLKRLAVAIAAATMVSTAIVTPVSAEKMKTTEQLARLAEEVPDATAKISGVPTSFTLVAETYYTVDEQCAVERTYVWSDEYRLFRHFTKSYWC